MPKPRRERGDLVKTTVLLPVALWEAAKTKAMKERTDLRSLIIAGLDAQVGRKRGGR
jgi:hypothetical protein